MLKNIKKILEFLINSNFWIAMATVCFYELSLLQNNIALQINDTIIFLFFSTLFVYNFYRILAPKDECKTWYAKNYSYTKFLSIISFIATIISFYFFNKKYIYLVAISGFLSFLYASPFFKIGKNSFNLRKYWFLKSIIVALVWTLTTSILPMKEFGIAENKMLLFSLEKFLFILGITIPYDIKDLKEDKALGIKTMAMKFGVKRTKFLSNTILFFAMIFLFSYISNTLFLY